MTKPQVRTLTTFIGAFLALVIVCAQLFHFQTTSTTKKQAKTEQNQKQQSGEEVYVAFTSFSLPSSVHVHLNLESHCLFEFQYEEESEVDYSIVTAHYAEKFFRTLFRTIISPNA